MAKIVLRPLNTNGWAGIIHYKNCYEDLASYYLRNGRRYTGFESEDEKENEVLEKVRDKLAKTLKTDLKQESIFWDTFFIRTREEDIILEDTDPYDQLKIMFLRKHDKVKNSLSENKAGARFVLINEEDEAKKQNLSVKNKFKALNELSTMTGPDLRDALRLYGLRSDDMSEQIAYAKLSEYIEKDPGKFIMLWVDNKDRKTQVMIERAIGRGIMRRTNLMYLYGTKPLGKTMEEAIAILNDPENQDVKLAIQKQLG